MTAHKKQTESLKIGFCKMKDLACTDKRCSTVGDDGLIMLNAGG